MAVQLNADPAAPVTRKELGYRAVGVALIVGGLVLAGLGLWSGASHAAPTQMQHDVAGAE